MDWMELLNRPDWVTVGIAAGCSLIASAFSAVLAAKTATARLKKEHLLQDQTEIVLRTLLEVGAPEYPQRLRSFSSLKARVPLSDEKLKEALLRAGAIQAVRPSDGENLWGLTKYHPDKL